MNDLSHGEKRQDNVEPTTQAYEYPAEDVDENIGAFWNWIRSEKISAHEWITALSSLALLFVTFGQLVVACNNARDTAPLITYARRNTEAAEKFEVAAEKINRGIEHAVDNLGDQAGATKGVASATQNAADTAKDTLHISQRAYITEGPPQIDYVNLRLVIPLINAGHIPSGETKIIAHEALFKIPDPNDTKTSFVLDRYWTKHNFSNIPIGNLISLTLDIPGLNRNEIDSGHQGFMILGNISYNDGFAGSNDKEYEFCIVTDFDPTAKRTNLVHCDAVEYLPKMTTSDQYPGGKYQKY